MMIIIIICYLVAFAFYFFHLKDSLTNGIVEKTKKNAKGRMRGKE